MFIYILFKTCKNTYMRLKYYNDGCYVNNTKVLEIVFNVNFEPILIQ